ncbi:MAG TPA: LexA family transcriptional regulator [Geobacteraceae bacterium]|nr:LexA family transcriptional regulator [Geobacteraceae bacterium]
MNNSFPTHNEPPTTIAISKRIHALRKMLKISQKEFAETIGISQGHLSVIEKGSHHPSDTLLLAICHRFKAHEEWLLDGKGEPFAETLPKRGIPVYSQLPDSYPDRPMSGEIIGHLSLPGLPWNSFAFYQRGDYMAPTIRANDLMVFEPVESIENEDLVLVKNKWDTWIVRRYRSAKNRSMFTADNPAYREFEYDIGKQKLLARVCAVLRQVNF